MAEDEAVNRMDLVAMLEDNGYEVVGQAANGEEAVELTRPKPRKSAASTLPTRVNVLTILLVLPAPFSRRLLGIDHARTSERHMIGGFDFGHIAVLV